MKGLIISTPTLPPHFSGAGTRIDNHVRYISDKGYDVVLVCLKGEVKHEQKISAYQLNVRKNKIRKILDLVHIIVASDYRVMHCVVGDNYNIFVGLLGKIFGKKILFEITLDGADDPVSISRGMWGIIKKKIFLLFDVVICISPLLEKRCLIAGVKKERVRLIPNSVNIKRFCVVSDLEKRGIRDDKGFDESQIIICSVCVIRERKGVEEIVMIFHESLKKNNQLKLILVGPINKDQENEEYYNKIMLLICSLGIEDSVHFTGYVDDVDMWLKMSDIFIFGSKQEGFGTAIIEAMSVGLPVIVNRIDGVTDGIVKNNENGFLYSGINEATLILDKLISEKQVRQKISLAAKNTVRLNYSEDVVMSDYIDLYERYK